MRSFHWRDAPQEGHKILLLLTQAIRVGSDAVMDGAYLRQLFAIALKIADGYVIHIAKIAVEIAKSIVVRMMDRVNKRSVHDAGVRQSRYVVQVDHVASGRGVGDGPGTVIDVFKVVVDLAPDG